MWRDQAYCDDFGVHKRGLCMRSWRLKQPSTLLRTLWAISKALGARLGRRPGQDTRSRPTALFMRVHLSLVWHCSDHSSKFRSLAMMAAASLPARTLLPSCTAGPSRALQQQRAAFSATCRRASGGSQSARCSAAGPSGAAAAGGPAAGSSGQRDYKVALITGANTGA